MCRKRKVYIVSLVLALIGTISWHSPSFEESRAKNAFIDARVRAYNNLSYEDEELLDIIDIEGDDYYIFRALEYQEDIYNSKVYSVVKCETKFILFRSCEQFAFMYEGHVGISWSYGERGTSVTGVKGDHNFSQVEIVLKDGSTQIVNVSETDIIFFYTSITIEIDDVVIIEE